MHYTYHLETDYEVKWWNTMFSHTFTQNLNNHTAGIILFVGMSVYSNPFK